MSTDPQRLKALFLAAADISDPAERGVLLDRECGSDADLRQRVEALLRAHDELGSFLSSRAEPVATSDAAAGKWVRPPEEPRPAEGRGALVGRYKLLQQIGEGGFGIVYMAEQQEPVRRKVALKIIKPGMDTREVVARFESERQALALMDHPNVARVFDAGATESGRPYFVMELVRGVPITEFCDKNHLPTKDRLELFNAVCAAVQHAHHKGVIHRDLKPSNILVTLHDGKPVPKVIDFGVAKATSHQLTQKTLFTAYGQMVGTPAYMSPEQAEMSGLDIDTRSDVYSLGVLLYELLTGTTPLELKRLRQAGYAEMQRLIREEEPPRPSTRLSSLGGEATVLAGNRGTDVRHLAQLLRGELDWIVMKALEKDRNRRYETASAFAADVDRFLRGDAILARPPSTLYRLHKFACRYRAAVLSAAALLFLLVLGIVGTSLGLIRAVSAEEAARHEASRARAAEELAEGRRVDAEQQRDDANQARKAAEASAGLLKVAVAQEDSGRLGAQSAAVLPSSPGTALLLAIKSAERAPRRSAAQNSALLAALRACREERTLFAVPFQTPEGRTGRTSFVSVRVTSDGLRAVVVGLRSNDPAGRYHFAQDKTDSANVYDLQSGKVTASMKLPGLWFGTMTLSPDGQLLAAATDRSAVVRYADGQTVAYTENAVRLWDVRTGREVRVLKGHGDRVSSLCFDATGQRLLSAGWDGAARIWEVATGKVLHVLSDGKASLAYAAFSPDGSRVVTVSTTGQMSGFGNGDAIRNRRYREPVRTDQVVRDPPVRVGVAIRWAEPITGISSMGGEHELPRLWDAQTGKRLAVLGDAAAERKGVSSTGGGAAGFTPDGARVVTVTADDDRMLLWNASDGKLVPVKERGRNPLSERLLEGNRTLRVAVGDGGVNGARPQLFIWQAEEDPGEWRRVAVEAVTSRTYWASEGVVSHFLAAGGRGRPLLASAAGAVVTVQDVSTGQKLAVLHGHQDRVAAAAFLPHGKRLLTAGQDGTLRTWDLGRCDPVVEVRRTDGPAVGYAVLLPGGKQVLTAPARDEFSRFAGRALTLWDAASGAAVHELCTDAALGTSPLHKQLLGDLCDLDVSPDGTRLVTVHLDANPCSDPKKEPQPSPLYTPVRVWSLRTGKMLFALPGLRRSVATARFSPDGRQILTFADGTHRYAMVDGKGRILGGGSGGERWTRVDLWDAETGRHTRNLVPQAFRRGDFALWAPDGKHIVTDTVSHSAAEVFDAVTGERTAVLKSEDRSIDVAAFSPDGKLVLGHRNLTITHQERVEVWDAVTGAKRCVLRGHTGDITSAGFSPDSRLVLTTSTDGTARLWSTANGEQRRVLRGHRHGVSAGGFSPDGKLLATASPDGTARLWSTETGAEWMVLPAAHGAAVVSVQFSTDGKRLLTVSTDGAARIWPVDPLALAVARKPRELTEEERALYQIDPPAR
jgi:WD40 repeat protein/serine/threonine protein kinase